MEQTAVLLAEYSEAGQVCRAQEAYVRTTLNMFLTLATAGAGFLVLSTTQPLAKALICGAIAGVALCMTLLVIRHRQVYAAFAARAREIEAELGMFLHTSAKNTLGAGEATAKTLSAFIIGIIGGLYLVAAIIFICKV